MTLCKCLDEILQESKSQIICASRTFVEELLPSFKQYNPHLQVLEELQPGKHPYFKAEYSESRLVDAHLGKGSVLQEYDFSLELLGLQKPYSYL